MKATIAPALLAAAAFLLGAAAGPVPGGEIGTLHTGQYICEIAGDGSGPSRQRVPSSDFRVITSSSYRAQGKSGTYLLTGDKVLMTSGPFKGQRYHRQTGGLLRVIDKQGNDTNLRCVLSPRADF